MADAKKSDFVRRSVRKVSQNSYIQLRNAKNELREKVRKVSEILKKPEHERTCADKALVKTNPDVVETSKKNAKRLKASKDRLLEIEDDPTILSEKCERLADLIKSSEYVVVYTGAGISTAASIPDYRGPNGVWTLLKKGQELCPQDLSDAEPTYTHMSLTKLFRVKKVKYVVSQNCDGLHIRSGFPRYSLSELHGNMYIEMCYNCAPHQEYVRLFDVTERTRVRHHATSRRCRACGVNLTDTIVHFGEKGKIKSPYRWKEAVRAAKKADLILCLGSSLKVLKKYACLWCMDEKPQFRPKLAIVNLQWTPKDDVATLKINGRCDNVMRAVMGLLEYDVPEYERDLDPIFRICTHLRANELKTTSKKILVPPPHLAKPVRQGKKSKINKEQQSPHDKKEQQTKPKADFEGTKSEMKDFTAGPFLSAQTTLQDKLSQGADGGDHTCVLEGVKVEAVLNVDEFGVPNLPISYAQAMKTLTSCPSISNPPHSIPSTLPGAEVVSLAAPALKDRSGLTFGVETKSSHLFTPASVVSISSVVSSHALPSSSNFTKGNLTVCQSVHASHVASSVLPSNVSKEPLLLNSIAVKPDNLISEQSKLNAPFNIVGASSVIDNAPNLVVVNLDMPTQPSPPLIPLLTQGTLTPTAVMDSSLLLSPSNQAKTLPLPATGNPSSWEDTKRDITAPFPVFLTCVGDQGQPITVSLNDLSPPASDLTRLAPTLASSVPEKAAVVLDHPYSHCNNTPLPPSNSKELPGSILPTVPCEVPTPIVVVSSVGTALANTTWHIPEDQYKISHNVMGGTSSKPGQQSSRSLSLKNNLVMNPALISCATSYDNIHLTDALHTSSPLSVAASGFQGSTGLAPMCVLNMDEMETLYTVNTHLQQSEFQGEMSKKAEEEEDMTLELQLPVGCEILTMDMLSTSPATMDNSNHTHTAGLNKKNIVPSSSQPFGVGRSPQLLNVGNVLNNSEPLVSSILSSALEPVVCDLGSSESYCQPARVERNSVVKGLVSDRIWSINLEDEGKTELGNLNFHSGETKLGQFAPTLNTPIPVCPNVNKLPCPTSEERIPLSPRSSEITIPSHSIPFPFTSPVVLKSESETSLDKSKSCNPHNSPNKNRALPCKTETLGVKGKKSQCKPKNETRNGIIKGLVNHVTTVAKQSGRENICKKVGKPKCAPSAVPGWFGKGLGFKKKRK